jgi:hypothetical protein
MRSNRVLLVAFISLFTISLNAQFFVGGNISFTSHNDKTDYGTASPDKSSGYNLNFLPKAGIFLSEKIAVGAALDVYLSGSTTVNNTENRSSTIGISPFLRYYAIKWNKFSVFGQGNVGLDLSTRSVKSGGTTTHGPKTISASLNVYPGLSYDISDKFSLETSFNIFSLGYYFDSSKAGSVKQTNSNFSFGAGIGNIVTVGDISIGAIFKF